MQKIGIIGRWAEFPPTGMFFHGTDKSKTRTIVIEFNSTARVAVMAKEVRADKDPRAQAEAVLVGVIDGLAAFEFRAAGDVEVYLIYLDDVSPSKVWFATEEGRNYAIDNEHLRDFAVPMLGRRERNPEMDAFRFEMKQQMLAQQQMFAEWMVTQKVQKEPEHGQSDEAKQPAKDKSGDPPASAGGSGDKDVRSSAEVSPERGVPAHAEVQGAATEGDPDRSAS